MVLSGRVLIPDVSFRTPSPSKLKVVRSFETSGIGNPCTQRKIRADLFVLLEACRVRLTIPDMFAVVFARRLD